MPTTLDRTAHVYHDRFLAPGLDYPIQQEEGAVVLQREPKLTQSLVRDRPRTGQTSRDGTISSVAPYRERSLGHEDLTAGVAALEAGSPKRVRQRGLLRRARCSSLSAL